MHLLIMSVRDPHGVRLQSGVIEETIGNRKQGYSRSCFAGRKEGRDSEYISGRQTDDTENRRVVRTLHVRRRSIDQTRLKKKSQLFDGIVR